MHPRRFALEQRCNRSGAFAGGPHRSEEPVFFRCPRRPRSAHFFAFCLATTIFNWAARFRTADSLLFICVAISAALVPDKARTRMRSSSYGVQTRPADFISPSPSVPLRVCSGQFFAYEPMTLSVLALVRSRGFSCRLRAFLAVGLLPRASKAGVHGEMWSFSLRLQPELWPFSF